MKTLLYISHAWPPMEGIASLRASRMVAHLREHGYRCAVLTGNGLYGIGDDPSIEDEAWRTVRAHFLDPAVVLSPLGRRVAASGKGVGQGNPASGRNGMLGQVKRNLLPLNMTRMPGRRLSWIPFAAVAFLRSGIRPDAVFTSSSPPESAMLGAYFSRRFGVPWIAEFRDLWSRNPVETLWPPLARLDEAVERRVLSGADLLATVSDELAASLDEMHHKPVLVLPNGHDAHEPPARPTSHQGPLRVLHGGSLYNGRRDPTILIEAIGKVVSEGVDIEATFMGHDASMVAGRIAAGLGLSDRVECLDPVPHAEYVKMMSGSDVLAVIEETSGAAAGNATGKLSEYVGTRRPVLAVAPVGGAIDRTLRKTGLGRAVTTVADMVGEIRKLASGRGFNPVEREIVALSRRSVAGRLARALDGLVER